ncbi:MAG: MFS transporter [Desulfobulbus propionicus]|nr:MAG: MFS transporter [Desulfobulbus propionicus]
MQTTVDRTQGDSQPLALTVICIIQFITPFLMAGVNIALPAIGKYYQATTFQLSLLSLLYLLGQGCMLLPSGQLADLYGRKRIYFLGISIYFLACISITFSPDIICFLIMTAFQGMAAAFISTASFAILSSLIPPERLGKSMGIALAFTYAGLSAGPILSGFLVYYIHWKAIFWLAALLAMLSLLVGIKALEGEWWGDRKQVFDYKGSLLFALTLICLTMTIIGKKWLGPLGSYFSLASGVGVVLFVLLELKVKTPVLPVRFLRFNIPFSLSILAALLNYAASFNIIFFFSLYLQSIRGFTALHAGLLLMIQTLVQCLLSPWAGKLADRIYPGKLATAGMGLCALALVLASQVRTGSSLALVVIIFIIMGTGFALFTSPNTTLVMNLVPRTLYGMASSLTAISRALGMLTGMGISAWLIEHVMGHTIISEQTSQGFMNTMHQAMIVFACICFLGIFCSMGRMRRA